MKNEQDFMKMAIRLPGSGLKEMLQRLLQGGQELGGRAVQGTKNFVNPMLDIGKNRQAVNFGKSRTRMAQTIDDVIRSMPENKLMEPNFVQKSLSDPAYQSAQKGLQRGQRNLAITGGVTAGGTVGGLGINELIKATRDKQASAPDFMKMAIGAGVWKGIKNFARPVKNLTKNRATVNAGRKVEQDAASGAIGRFGPDTSQRGALYNKLKAEPEYALGKRNLAITGLGALGVGGVGAGAYGLGSHRGYEQGGQAGFGLGQQYGMANAANTQQQSGFLSRLMDMFAPSGNRSLQGAQMAAWDPRLLRVMREQQRAAKS